MTGSTLRRIVLVLTLAALGAPAPSLAEKRRPTGCDWIGGDFADPADLIFRSRCRQGAGPKLGPTDQAPKLNDRTDARPPAHYGATTRKLIGSGIQSFQIVGGKVAYGVDSGGRLWRTVLGGAQSTQVAEKVKGFRATDDGALYILGTDGALWRAKDDGSQRALIDHDVQDFQPVGDLVYLLTADKRLWRAANDGKSRDLVDETVAAFKALDAKSLFVLGTDGALWRETSDFHTREKIGQPIFAFDYVADGDATYVLGRDHILWRRTGKDAPQQVDHDVAAFHPADMFLVYVLATDGRLWQELGDRSQAVLVDSDLALKSGAAAFQFVGPGDQDGQALYLLDRGHSLWAETMPPARGGASGKP